MNKKDCEIGMFVAVVQHISPLSKSRTKVRRVGQVVGLYDGFANLLLFDSNINNDFPDWDNIIIKRNLYKETFKFSELVKIEGPVKDER